MHIILFACKYKSFAVVCNSTPEAELAAAHVALRTVGLPALDVFDLVCKREPPTDNDRCKGDEDGDKD